MIHPVIAFFAPGGGELIIIMLALLLLFGPKDAPRILRSIQTALNKMQRAAADFRYKLMYEDLHQHQNQAEESIYTTAQVIEETPVEESPAVEPQSTPTEPPTDPDPKL
jgi:Sec-independent protein translocase protein TatA